MAYMTKRRVIDSVEEINEIIKGIDKFGLKVYTMGIGGEYHSFDEIKHLKQYRGLSDSMIFDLKETKLEITTGRYNCNGSCTYIFDLNGEGVVQFKGLDCFREMSRYYKVPKAEEYPEEFKPVKSEETGKYVDSASPLVNYNRNYQCVTLKDCYEYDLNSAYTSILLKGIPDLEHPRFPEHKYDLLTVGEGEVGFKYWGEMEMRHTGEKADIAFKIIPTPEKLVKFCEKYYLKKKTSVGLEKLTAKAMLNLPIGYTQRVNPFFRAYIVCSCNEVIKSLIDKDCLFWNTDAIFTRKKREDLKVGTNIGEWKEVYCETIKYVGNTYQIGEDEPVYRGVCKAWFKNFEKVNGRKFDILKDHITQRMNKYEFDMTTYQIREVIYG